MIGIIYAMALCTGMGVLNNCSNTLAGGFYACTSFNVRNTVPCLQLYFTTPETQPAAKEHTFVIVRHYTMVNTRNMGTVSTINYIDTLYRIYEFFLFHTNHPVSTGTPRGNNTTGTIPRPHTTDNVMTRPKSGQ